jgi:hypothetical protein
MLAGASEEAAAAARRSFSATFRFGFLLGAGNWHLPDILACIYLVGGRRSVLLHVW